MHYTSNVAVELCELVHIRRSASCRKDVVDKVIDVLPYPVVEIGECLHMPLNALEIVRMSEQSRTICVRLVAIGQYRRALYWKKLVPTSLYLAFH